MRATTGNVWVFAAATALVACGGADTPGDAADPAATRSAAVGRSSKGEELSVRTATAPADPCAWIPVGEVEAVIGKLAAAPTPQDGCRYTLVLPEEIRAKRQQDVERRDKMRAQVNDPTLGRLGVMADYQSDPKSYAMTLQVNVRGEFIGDVGVEGRDSTRPADTAAGQPQVPPGWDAVPRAPRYGFNGRLGHVHISVMGKAPDVPKALAQALAERVRDRLPDLPFKVENAYQIVQTAGEGQHPCSLLTRAEAEAVLGTLVVEPYRASSEWPPLAHAEGHGCAYYTAGHRVFSIVPMWSNGRQDFALNKGVGGLLSMVMPAQEQLLIKGPWDDAQMSAKGALRLLKGDRLLEVYYRTSSTDLRGAVKLAAQAAQRL